MITEDRLTIQAAASTPALSDDQRQTLAAITEDIRRLNAAICGAVENGLSIELRRTSRHHSGAGAWGDMMEPVVVKW
jgi:hypothetical protein